MSEAELEAGKRRILYRIATYLWVPWGIRCIAARYLWWTGGLVPYLKRAPSIRKADGTA